MPVPVGSGLLTFFSLFSDLSCAVEFFKDDDSGINSGHILENTLLLNASFEPLRVISWQKAVTLSFLGKVEIVHSYDREIRSVSLAIRVPAVVRLLRYVQIGTRRPPLTKLNILARDQYSCQYCRQELTRKDATLDHVLPRSRGGKTAWDNLVIACHSCNRKKGGLTPKEAGMKLLKPPIQPEWLPVLSLRFQKNLPDAWLIFLG